LDHLAHPPEGWPHPPVDIQASRQSLVDRVLNGTYSTSGEYQFQSDLYRLFLSARDGHFSFIPDLFGVASFQTPQASLVSVSPDGLDAPDVYLRSDVLDFSADGVTAPTVGVLEPSFMPSPISRINGIQTVDYLSTRLGELPFHDSDAAYNFLFSEVAQIVQFGPAGDGAFPHPLFYPGPETVIEFVNGSTIHLPTLAELRVDFEGVTDGPSAYEKFCTRSTPNWSPPSPPGLGLPPAIPFYPDPVVRDSQNHVAGYFLNDTAHDDTAILSILNFDAQDDPSGFQTTVSTFLERCKTSGKTRLIVDVFANGGGIVELGLDTFVQLLPNLSPDAYATMRVSPLLNSLGLGNSRHLEGEPPSGSAFDVRLALRPDGSTWSNWSALSDGSGSTTNLFRTNLDVSSPPTLRVTPTNGSAEPPFDPANVVLLTDGYCASTCAIFAELLKTRTAGRVRSVVVGGRPDQHAMQALGATKGRAFWSFASILAGAQSAVQGLTQHERFDATSSSLSTLARLSDLPLRRTFRPEAAGVNGVNHIRVGVDGDDPVPLQFVRDEADMHLFFTPAMLASKETLWERVATAAFGTGATTRGG
jgi:hypothetical protein